MELKNQERNILLIEDDISICKMLSLLLESRNYCVETAHSGCEGLEKIKPITELILLDLGLPDQDGFELCRKIKENRSTQHLPVIILSSRILSENITHGLQIGADDYLTKPFEYEELVARIEAVMRRASVKQNSFDDSESGANNAIFKEINEIIAGELMQPYFQPIYLINHKKVLGVEALCRPVSKGVLANPEELFKAAIQYNVYSELELIAWRKAAEVAGPVLRDEKLFLNCNPYLVEGIPFDTIKGLFDRSNMLSSNIVLEITERSAISEYKMFYAHLSKYRREGFRFAVDDVGGGYASLESIVETRPEVLKIDRHIIQQLHNDTYKKSIVRFIVSFCRENNIISIAEGIETDKDLQTVRDLGIDAVQGYLLSRPAPEIDLKEINQIAASL